MIKKKSLKAGLYP